MAIRRVTRAGVGLVVGIIIIAALVFAGLWFVRERGEEARRQEAINIADQQLQEESDQEVAIDTNETAADEEKDETSKPEATAGTSTGTSSSNQAATANELPQTGPESQALIALGALTFAVAAFVRSRKLTV